MAYLRLPGSRAPLPTRMGSAGALAPAIAASETSAAYHRNRALHLAGSSAAFSRQRRVHMGDTSAAYKRRRMLGQDPSNPMDIPTPYTAQPSYEPIDFGLPIDISTPYTTPPSVDLNLPVPAMAPYNPTIPTSIGPQAVAPSAAAASILTQMQTVQTPGLNALDYVSPASAIAAGMDPSQVYAQWTAALACFSTQQQAIAQGVPAAVVTQLWAMSRGVAAQNCGAVVTSSWTTYLPYLAVGGLALLLLSGGKGRH